MKDSGVHIELAEHDFCTGCGACASACPKNCISIVEDREGFVYPEIDADMCIGCRKCENTCPILNNKREGKGCTVIESYAFRLNDDKKLFKSSSGGVFYALASEVIENNGAVVGAVYNDRLEVVHTVARCMSDVEKMMGSKYVQSRMGDMYRETKSLLDDGIYVLFTGTPCQIDGLKHYLGCEFKNLLTVDMVCDGVPSPRVFRDYVRYAEQVLHTKIRDIRMRNKKYSGWCTPDAVMLDNRNRFIMRDSRVVPWTTLYFDMMFVRPSCHNCIYCNVNRAGDFTIADYWDRNHIHDEVYSKKGTSLVFVNSEKARHFFSLIRQKNYFSKIPWEDMLQPRLQTTPMANPNRAAFWTDYSEFGFDYCYNKYFSVFSKNFPRPTVIRKIKRWIKDLLISGPWKFDEELYATKRFKIVTILRKFSKL